MSKKATFLLFFIFQEEVRLRVAKTVRSPSGHGSSPSMEMRARADIEPFFPRWGKIGVFLMPSACPFYRFYT
jgi:hypothetical protein